MAVRVNKTAIIDRLLKHYAEKVALREGGQAIHAIVETATYSYPNFHPPLVLSVSLRVHLPIGNLTLDQFQTLLQYFPAGSMGTRDNNNGAMPLHGAARGGAPREILRLLAGEHAAALYTRDSTGAVPLHHACQANTPTLDAIRYYLAEQDRAALDTPDNDGALPLHLLLLCARTNGTPPPLDVFKYMVRTSPGSVSVQMRDGTLPVMLACQAADASSSLDVLRELLTEHPEARPT